MKSGYLHGREAEQKAAEYLKQQGFRILDTNWKSRFCEIDIVAQKDNRIFFVEAKYRQRKTWGTSLEYITPAKLKRMAFAAESWVHEHRWTGEYQLAGLGIDEDKLTFVLITA